MLGSELRAKISRAPGILFLRMLKSGFRFWQRLGVHVIPNHFYEPVPDTRKLPERLWSKPSEAVGLDFKDAAQVALLGQFTRFKSEYDALPRRKTGVPHQFSFQNPSFGYIDAEVLYSMVRHFQPQRLYEIGSGNSTYLSAQAILKNQETGGPTTELVAFEPYPNEVLQAGFPGLTRLVRKPVQEIPLEEFDRLGDGDILFIDSSHVLKIGSDVQYEYLELIPRLNKGVIIHIHDIFLPAEYPRIWSQKFLIFWNEQYLLQAFLAFNDSFEVLWGGNYMHLRHPDKLKEAFGSYGPGCMPGSFWLRKIK